MKSVFMLAALAGVSIAESEIGWSYHQALIGHQLSKASYCGVDAYLTH